MHCSTISSSMWRWVIQIDSYYNIIKYIYWSLISDFSAINCTPYAIGPVSCSALSILWCRCIWWIAFSMANSYRMARTSWDSRMCHRSNVLIPWSMSFHVSPNAYSINTVPVDRFKRTIPSAFCRSILWTRRHMCSFGSGIGYCSSCSSDWWYSG